MFDSLVQDIVDYVTLLRTHHHLDVTIHDRTEYLPLYYPQLVPFNVHQNPYCAMIKQKARLQCLQKQTDVCARAGQGAFCGICWCGVAECVFPIRTLEEEPCGFICVTGYRSKDPRARQRVKRAADTYGFDKAELTALYRRALDPDLPDLAVLEPLIHPLAHMLTLLHEQARHLQERAVDTTANAEDPLYHQLVSYLNCHYMERITLPILAEVFHCSCSHISHVFSSYGPTSMNRYLNALRVQAAKQLLENTELGILEIAFSVGFSDANYFSTAFKKTTGMNPRAWRKSYRQHRAAGIPSPESAGEA